MKQAVIFALYILLLQACVAANKAPSQSWVLVDDFENTASSQAWMHIDRQNETDPFVPDPQIAETRKEAGVDNSYLLRKPAVDGVVGNRKAISYRALPESIPLGQTYTLYTRVNVEAFPNNHSFGLSNLGADDIADAGYDMFEPMIRLTDKAESDGSKNDGTLMVLSGYKTYAKIENPLTGKSAQPLTPGTWYEIWAVINNALKAEGGQTYDLYVRGGEFASQQQVFSGGVFRMNRDMPLTGFMAIANTGPKKQPYGNGGVRYDDIYLAEGTVLTTP